jgi:hypothetical protein
MLMNPRLCIAAVLLAGLTAPVNAGDLVLPEDARQAVEMPALQRSLMREDMVHHLTAFNEVLVLLNAGKLKEAADVAEADMGLSSMGKHAAKTQGKGPGRFMPDGMRSIGIGMHKSASEFAELARKGDLVASYKALEPVTGACVACHAGYRLK